MPGLLLASILGCAQHAVEDPAAWYDPGTPGNVDEPVAFTDEAYTLDGNIAGLSAVFPTANDGIVFAPGDGYGDSTDCQWSEDDDLPMQITGVVTIDPKYYYKTPGCSTDDEKFYGSFFLEDKDGAVFVLGDSKVAHFQMGDEVTLNVRGARTRYDLDMITTWDTVSIDTSEHAIHYETVFNPFDFQDEYLVRRITGTVASKPDTFGQFSVDSDDGTASWFVQIDSELNRRGFTIEPGRRLEVTGPVLYSYSQFSIVVMRSGQVTFLD